MAKKEKTQNEEVVSENIETEETVEAEENITLTASEFNQVKEHIDSLQKEKDEMVALAQRLQADFDNYRKRNATIAADNFDEGGRNIIKALLPVIDNFDRAMDAVDGLDESLVQGISLVRKQLMDTLEKCGLEEIKDIERFDPQLHNAVMQEKVEGKESGEIIEVFQKGYKVKDRIIRYSMVKVAE